MWLCFHQRDGRIGCSFRDSFLLEMFLLLKISPVALGQGRGREGILFCQGQNVKTYGLFCLNEEQKMGCVRGAAPFTGSLEGHRDPPPPEQTSASRVGAPALQVAALEVQGVCFSQVDASLVSHST